MTTTHQDISPPIVITNQYETNGSVSQLRIVDHRGEKPKTQLQVLFDTADMDLVRPHKWMQNDVSYGNNPYVYAYRTYKRTFRRKGQKKAKEQRTSTTLGHWLLTNGEPPHPALKVKYHESTFDCRRAHISLLSQADISAMASDYTRSSKLPRGVIEDGKMYRVQFGYGGRPHNARRYDTVEQAAAVYAYLVYTLRPHCYPQYEGITLEDTGLSQEEANAILAKARDPDAYTAGFRAWCDAGNNRQEFFEEWARRVNEA